MPEARVLALVERARTRLRAIGLLWAAAGGVAVFAATLVIMPLVGFNGLAGPVPAPLTGAIATLLLGVRAWRRWSVAEVASILESAAGTLDNLVVTSVQVAERPGKVLLFIRAEVAAQAEARLSSIDVPRVLPATRAIQMLAVTVAGTGVLLWPLFDGRDIPMRIVVPGSTLTMPASIDRVEVVVTPPAYTRLNNEAHVNPSAVTVLAGSRVRIAVATRAPDPSTGSGSTRAESRVEVTLAEPGAEPLVFPRLGEARAIELVADRSRTFALTARMGTARDERLIALIVRPDLRPLVRVNAPGKDVMLPKASPIDVQIETADDLALQSVALKYTRASGSGESFTFQEGEVPLQVTRADSRRWTATARWAIDGLKLEEGDTLVYRAVARDANPAGDEVSSESYLIEIGRASALDFAGFALPEDERRYAISQQMVIVKTERLQQERTSLAPDVVMERARGIAVEQRMVKAEFIFLSGGEVEDEVVEAEQSHELVEGRLENLGRAEMLRAIAAMTRAEERLNIGDTQQALVHERAALQALQRAFDRRRYFLRVTAERARIDASRRLTGKLDEAQSWTRSAAAVRDDEIEARERELTNDLTRGPIDAALAARVAALDPGSPEWQRLTQRLLSRNLAAQVQALDAVRDALRARAAARLAPAADMTLRGGPSEGFLADATRDQRRRP